MDLTAFFAQIPDPRRAQGRRYPLPALLWMTFLGIASGYVGYRQLDRFVRSNAAFFAEYFGLRHGVPSYVSFRNLLKMLDKEQLAQAFTDHFAPQVQPGDWIACDGQSLRSTGCHPHDADQSFVSVVSLYCQRTGLTCALRDHTTAKVGEREVFKTLLPALQQRGVIFTLDALHSQKKQPPPS